MKGRRGCYKYSKKRDVPNGQFNSNDWISWIAVNNILYDISQRDILLFNVPRYGGKCSFHIFNTANLSANTLFKFVQYNYSTVAHIRSKHLCNPSGNLNFTNWPKFTTTMLLFANNRSFPRLSPTRGNRVHGTAFNDLSDALFWRKINPHK